MTVLSNRPQANLRQLPHPDQIVTTYEDLRRTPRAIANPGRAPVTLDDEERLPARCDLDYLNERLPGFLGEVDELDSDFVSAPSLTFNPHHLAAERNGCINTFEFELNGLADRAPKTSLPSQFGA